MLRVVFYHWLRLKLCWMCSCSMTQVFLRPGDQSISHAVLVKAGEVGKEKGAATIIVGNINRKPILLSIHRHVTKMII